jgi:hypothetical protein
VNRKYVAEAICLNIKGVFNSDWRLRWSPTRVDLIDRFILRCTYPKLFFTSFKIVYPDREPEYNCYAYAVGKNEWLEPETLHWHWHYRLAREHGFTDAGSGGRKLALFITHNRARHMAIQKPDGTWSWKLGAGPIMESNSLKAAEIIYGPVGLFMEKAA